MMLIDGFWILWSSMSGTSSWSPRTDEKMCSPHDSRLTTRTRMTNQRPRVFFNAPERCEGDVQTTLHFRLYGYVLSAISHTRE